MAVAQGSVLSILALTPAGGTPRELSRTTIASGFEPRTDPAALVIGRTGDRAQWRHHYRKWHDGNMVETTPNGKRTLFGLAIAPHDNGVYFVDDGNNTLNLIHSLNRNGHTCRSLSPSDPSIPAALGPAAFPARAPGALSSRMLKKQQGRPKAYSTWLTSD
jgi:hypothetical protein